MPEDGHFLHTTTVRPSYSLFLTIRHQPGATIQRSNASVYTHPAPLTYVSNRLSRRWRNRDAKWGSSGTVPVEAVFGRVLSKSMRGLEWKSQTGQDDAQHTHLIETSYLGPLATNWKYRSGTRFHTCNCTDVGRGNEHNFCLMRRGG